MNDLAHTDQRQRRERPENEPTRDDRIAADEPTRDDVLRAIGLGELEQPEEELEVIGLLDCWEPPSARCPSVAKAKPRRRSRRPLPQAGAKCA